MTSLLVLSPGPLALIQDLGRPGHADLGVGPSGPADRRAHALANRLLANPPQAAGVEITLGGFAARVCGEPGDVIEVALTGAHTILRVDGIAVGYNSIARARVGQVVSVEVPAGGLRCYLAVRGGIDVPPVLGSRSTDVLSGIGPAPVAAGDQLPVGPRPPTHPRVALAPIPGAGRSPLRMLPGPQLDWLADPDALVTTAWRVDIASDRVGMRLTGPPLVHVDPTRQLPSAGLVRGAIQVPPSGLPVVFGPDHPVTGGYPVAGVLLDADADGGAQLRPGEQVRLRWA